MKKNDLIFFNNNSIKETFNELHCLNRNNLINKIIDAVYKEVFLYCKEKYLEINQNINKLTFSFSIKSNQF